MENQKLEDSDKEIRKIIAEWQKYEYTYYSDFGKHKEIKNNLIRLLWDQPHRFKAKDLFIFLERGGSTGHLYKNAARAIRSCSFETVDIIRICSLNNHIGIQEKIEILKRYIVTKKPGGETLLQILGLMKVRKKGRQISEQKQKLRNAMKEICKSEYGNLFLSESK